MLKLRLRNRVGLVIALIGGGMLAQPVIAQDIAGARDVLARANAKWRSSDRYIDVEALEAVVFDTQRLGPRILEDLSRLSKKEILTALKAAAESQDPELRVNQGMAENLLKIREIFKRRRLGGTTKPRLERLEVVFGLTQADLDRDVASLPPVASGNIKRGEFDFNDWKVDQAMKQPFMENDFYAFKRSYLWWKLKQEGKLDATATAELMPRGKKDIALWNAVGQDFFLRLVTQLRFTEDNIQYLSQKLGSGIDPEFYNYLRRWRFTGDIETLEPGTLIPSNTPVLQITARAEDIPLLEALALAFMDDFIRAGTHASRAVIAAGKEHALFETGTRRGMGGFIRAYAAYVSGFAGTADTRAADLFGAKPVGSALAHSEIAALARVLPGGELGVFAEAAKLFPAKTAYFLTDTFGNEGGTSNVIRGAGIEVLGTRPDSPLENKDLLETVRALGEMNAGIGYRSGKDGDTGLHVSDSVTALILQALKEKGIPYDVAQIGGDLRNAAAPGVVYKTTQLVDNATGKVYGVAKLSGAGKKTYAGKKQVYRVIDANGKFVRDIRTEASESAPVEGAIPLLQPGIRNGKLVRFTGKVKERVVQQRAYHEAQVASMPVDVVSIRSADGAYPTVQSERLQALYREIEMAHGPASRGFRVGVFPFSGDPAHEDHVALVKSMKERYLLDVVYVVPTGNAPPHGKRYALSADARLDLAQRLFAGLDWVRFYDGEVKNPEPTRTRVTLAAIEEQVTKEKGGTRPDIYVMAGSDLMSNQFSTFQGKEMLTQLYNWVFAKRVGSKENSAVQKPADLPQKMIRNHEDLRGDGKLLRNRETGKYIELGEYRGIRSQSSTAIRAFYDALPYAFLMHVTDPQWTFTDRSAKPGSTQQADGALKVDGTHHTFDNVTEIVRRTYEARLSRMSLSADSHLMAEVEDPNTYNPEFTVFKNADGTPLQHGMKGRSGPDGDRFLEEIETTIPQSTRIDVPSNEEYVEGGKRKLRQAPFDWAQHERTLRSDLSTVPRFEKNGLGAHTVFSNPHFVEYLQMIDPHRVLPQFHLGYCTDYCVRDAILTSRDNKSLIGAARRGYQVYLIVDASAGVVPESTAQALVEMAEAGVRFMSTAEYLALLAEWKEAREAGKLSWSTVVNRLTEWKKTSPTQAWVLEKIRENRGRYTNDIRLPKTGCPGIFGGA